MGANASEPVQEWPLHRVYLDPTTVLRFETLTDTEAAADWRQRLSGMTLVTARELPGSGGVLQVHRPVNGNCHHYTLHGPHQPPSPFGFLRDLAQACESAAAASNTWALLGLDMRQMIAQWLPEGDLVTLDRVDPGLLPERKCVVWSAASTGATEPAQPSEESHLGCVLVVHLRPDPNTSILEQHYSQLARWIHHHRAAVVLSPPPPSQQSPGILGWIQSPNQRAVRPSIFIQPSGGTLQCIHLALAEEQVYLHPRRMPPRYLILLHCGRACRDPHWPEPPSQCERATVSVRIPDQRGSGALEPGPPPQSVPAGGGAPADERPSPTGVCAPPPGVWLSGSIGSTNSPRPGSPCGSCSATSVPTWSGILGRPRSWDGPPRSRPTTTPQPPRRRALRSTSASGSPCTRNGPPMRPPPVSSRGRSASCSWGGDPPCL